MNQVCNSAGEAMRVAFELTKLLKRPVWRYMGVDKRGATVWVVSLEKVAQNAL